MDKVKREYDFIFSLGAACSCSQSLRAANLQFASFPCDWLFGGTPSMRAQGLVDGFVGWFGKEKLVKHTVPWNLEHEPWRNVETGIVFKHDFDWNTPLDEMIPNVQAKYARRLARLSLLIERSKKVLVVWLNPPTCEKIPLEEFILARQKLAARWSGVEFDFLVLECERGRDFDARRDDDKDGMRLLAWDYFDNREAFIDNEKMGRFLAAEYDMADYRTEEERRAWPARQKALKYAQYNATTYLGYKINRFYYKLYRHIRKEIIRRGLDKLG